MVFKAGKAKDKATPANRTRLPLNYYSSGSSKSERSPFVKKTPSRGRTRKFFVRSLDAAVIIIILGGLIYSLLVKDVPLISVNDTTYHSAADYKAAATKQLKLFKNHNKITFDEEGLVQALQKQFPEIASGSVELPVIGETPAIHLNVARPSFFLSSKGINYVIDSQGVATSIAKNLPQVKNLTTLSDQSGFGGGVGRQLLSAQSVSFINNLLAQVAHAKVPVGSLTLPAQVQELDLKTSDRGYYIKFYLGGDPLVEAGQFLAARHNFDQSGQQPAQYLDVRVPGKIFYK